MKRYVRSKTYTCFVTLKDLRTNHVVEDTVYTTAVSEDKACNNASYVARGHYPGYYVVDIFARIDNDPSEILPVDADRQQFCPYCNVPLEADGRCPECSDFF